MAIDDTRWGANARLINEKWFSNTPEGLVMVGSHCQSCGQVFFPKKRVCPRCFTLDAMDNAPLSRKGELYTYTIAESGPPGFPTPYAFGYVDLPEGVRVFTLLTDCHPCEDVLRIDLDVEMVIRKITQDPQGIDVIGYKFRPVNKKET